MSLAYTIRPADSSDAASLSDFAAKQFRATYSDDTPAEDLDSYIAESFDAQKQAGEIADPSGAVFIAASEEKLIGYVHLLFGDAPAFLNRIYVDADWKGSGVASALLEIAVAEARRRKAVSLELTVFERNARAIRFYEREGFATTGTTSFTVGEEVQSDLVMRKPL